MFLRITVGSVWTWTLHRGCHRGFESYEAHRVEVDCSVAMIADKHASNLRPGGSLEMSGRTMGEPRCAEMHYHYRQCITEMHYHYRL